MGIWNGVRTTALKTQEQNCSRKKRKSNHITMLFPQMSSQQKHSLLDGQEQHFTTARPRVDISGFSSDYSYTT